MKHKPISLFLVLCIVFSLFSWNSLTTAAKNLDPPDSVSSTDREPDMRYQQTCYIIPDNVNVMAGQSEYIQTSMGTHQTEHYSSFRWTSSDTSVATVDIYGNVTGVATGTATISLAFTAYSHMEYDSCDVEVIPITEGLYYVKNKNSGKYLSIDDDVCSDGTYVSQTEYTGDTTQKWRFTYLSNGLYKITPYVNSLMALHSDSLYPSNGTELNVWTFVDANDRKFKVELNEDNFSYRLTPNLGQLNYAVSVFNSSYSEGELIELSSYSSNHANSEWILEPVDFYSPTLLKQYAYATYDTDNIDPVKTYPLLNNDNVGYDCTNFVSQCLLAGGNYHFEDNWYIYKKNGNYDEPQTIFQLNQSWTLSDPSPWISAPTFEEFWSNRLNTTLILASDIQNSPLILNDIDYHVGDVAIVFKKDLFGLIYKPTHAMIITSIQSINNVNVCLLTYHSIDKKDEKITDIINRINPSVYKFEFIKTH